MKLVVAIVMCCLLALVASDECPSVMFQRKCTNPLNSGSLDECQGMVAGWTECDCQYGYTCFNKGVGEDCVYRCYGPANEPPGDNDADMSIYAALKEETTVAQEEEETTEAAP